ncbi:L-threonine ammonia-lyase-like isoform X2 [Ambystoma mexicanum]|uniref:L-threonine ammonia-lyase-like isoform X2 n=1 Tax=Ambystoma mexicanum TaxID=8296 RepID=UPI0037E8FC7B
MNFAAQFWYSKASKDRAAWTEAKAEEDNDPFWQRGEKKLKRRESLRCRQDGPGQNGSHVPRPTPINPERLKDFGEEDYLNGDVKTWEMKIVGHPEELLKDAPRAPPPQVTPSPVNAPVRRASIRPRSEVIRFEDISAAAFKIQGGVQKTPCMYSRLSKQYGIEIYLKKEYLQYTGSVKERGVLYMLTTLPQEQQRKGVIAALDSNFAMAVAFHASELSIPVFIIVPTSVPPARVKICREYGAMVISYGTTVQDSHSHARRLAQENAYLFIEEEDDAVYLAGLGTVGLEIYEQVPKLDAVLFPAGGHCGLLAGSAAALKHLNPNIDIIGVEPERFPILQQSLKMDYIIKDQDGVPNLLYGDLSETSFGNNSLQLSKKLVDKVITVREEDVLLSMLRLLECERATVDAAGAIGLAALVAGKLPELKGKRVAIALCSGNLELPLFQQCINRALTLDGRLCRFSLLLPDCPAEMSKLMELLSREEVRVLGVTQEHVFATCDLFSIEVTCTVETRDRSHTSQVRVALADRYPTLHWRER